MKIFNIEELPDKFIWQDSAGLITRSLGEAGGSGKIYVNIDTVPPNAYSTKYHSHTQQEEFFLILSGEGTLRLDNREYPVKRGDFLAKPGGREIAHTFYNSGGEELVILDVGTKEIEDTCYYPDENIYLHKANGQHHVFRGDSLEESWTSEPNQDRNLQKHDI